MPIAFGMNYTDLRQLTPQMCTFYNADFLIYSSMGSFYIPCVVMVLLYWRIFLVIRRRTRRAALQKRARQKQQAKQRQPLCGSAKPAANRTTSDASATEDNSQKELLPPRKPAAGGDLARTPITEETSFTNYNAKLTPTDTDEGASVGGGGGGDGVEPPSQACDSSDGTSGNDKSVVLAGPGAYDENNHNDLPPAAGAAHTAADADGCPARKTSSSTAAGNGRRSTHLLELPPKNNGIKVDISNINTPKSHSVTKFNFRMRHSKKKKDRSANKRERKATKTLAIVLGEPLPSHRSRQRHPTCPNIPNSLPAIVHNALLVVDHLINIYFLYNNACNSYPR